MTTIFDQWHAGTITDHQALHALVSDLREVEGELAPLQAERDRLRDQISRIVARTGKVRLNDVELKLTAPARTVSYDRAALDALALELTTAYPTIAARIAATRRESTRSGGLRIEPIKKHGS